MAFFFIKNFCYGFLFCFFLGSLSVSGNDQNKPRSGKSENQLYSKKLFKNSNDIALGKVLDFQDNFESRSAVKNINSERTQQEIQENDIQRKFSDDYEKVKEKLRNIFANEVEPAKYEVVKENSRKRNTLFDINSVNVNKVRDTENDLQKRQKFETNGYHHAGHEHTKAYLNEWVVHLTGGKDFAASVARELGYTLKGQVGSLTDIYRLVKEDHPRLHKREAPELTHKLNGHAEVLWAEQQYVKERSKRYILPKRGILSDGQESYDPNIPRIRKKRTDFELELEEFKDNKRDLLEEELKKSMEKVVDTEIEQEMVKEIHSLKRRSAEAANAYRLEKMYNDPLWVHQWYLFDTRTRGDLPKLDLQVIPVWEMGFTGKGVNVLVLDDGLEWTHEDIRANYNRDISYDVNDDKEDPTPRYDEDLSNSHGTRCAGEIAMLPNNRNCGVGIAHGARVGGIRMLDGPVSDIVEGTSLGWALKHADIFTCSWGPTDDGTRVEGPGKLAQMSVEKGVQEGRNGKGIIYVWAAGNGGSVGDDCNCDGYTSSIYTLSISSASESGLFPWYGERCSSTLATAYSSGAYTDQKITTTDLHNTCTDSFAGTSAAAPLAAGIFALALEANPELTWRDMQHAVVWTSEWGSLADNDGWQTNGRGLKFNPRFGFGLLSAKDLVEAAQGWKQVPDKFICTLKSTSRSSSTLKTGDSVEVEFDASICNDQGNDIRFLEHVQVMANIDYSRRGALKIAIISPQGTKTNLLNQRAMDDSDKGFKDWNFMTVHTWGENPKGVWKIIISDETEENQSGSIGDITLFLHGTKDIPHHMKQARRYYFNLKEIRRETRNEDSTKEIIHTENLESLSEEELISLLNKSTRSTFSESDIQMLLEENRLEETVRNLQAQRELESNPEKDKNDWEMLIDEIIFRKK